MDGFAIFDSRYLISDLKVPKEGIEPSLLTEHDFESCASTNSATSASQSRKVCFSQSRKARKD